MESNGTKEPKKDKFQYNKSTTMTTPTTTTRTHTLGTTLIFFLPHEDGSSDTGLGGPPQTKMRQLKQWKLKQLPPCQLPQQGLQNQAQASHASS
eukprot:3941576-Amphidinium_carterae.1